MGNCWLDIRAVEVVADFHHLLLFWRTVASLLILKFSAWGYFQVGKGPCPRMVQASERFRYLSAESGGDRVPFPT
jgi:hypothetical protein